MRQNLEHSMQSCHRIPNMNVFERNRGVSDLYRGVVVNDCSQLDFV